MRRFMFRSVGVCAFLLSPAAAQFGVNKRQKFQASAEKGAGRGGGGGSIDPLPAMMREMMADPELREAAEMLAGMSPEEVEETLRELVGAFGDNPETAAALLEAMEEVSAMSVEDIESSLGQMATDHDVADATLDALKMLADAEENTISTILERKDVILESVVRSGQITEADAERYRTNPLEWENELREIWSELRRQAEESL